MPSDPFEALGLDSTASFEEARAAYRRLAEIYHPDRYQESRPEVRDEAAQRMRDLNDAWDRISRARGNGHKAPPADHATPTPRSERPPQQPPTPPTPAPESPRFPPPHQATKTPPPKRLDPMWTLLGAIGFCFILAIGWLVFSFSGDDSSNNAATVERDVASPSASPSTTSSPTTPTIDAPKPETGQTVPGPPEPQAPWASGAVAPTGTLIDIVTGWNDARSFDDPWQCALYAPTELESQVGLVSSFYPQATRIGDFQFGWDDGAGNSPVLVSIWPADNPNVERFFADPTPTVYSDGSETRQDPAGSTLLGDTLISIPGEPCHYELSCDSTVSCSWAFESFREITT